MLIWIRRLSLAIVLPILVSSVLALGWMWASDWRVALPGGLTDRIESQVDARLAEGAPSLDQSLDLGRIEVGIGREGRPQLWLTDVVLGAPGGGEIARLAQVGVAVDRAAALRGRLAARSLTVDGSALTIRRDAFGAFEIDFGGGGTMAAMDLAGVLSSLRSALDAPPLDRIDEVRLEGTTITLEDARSPIVWQLLDGRARIARTDGGLSLGFGADLFNGTDELSRVDLTADLGPGGAVDVAAEVTGIQAADLARQAPALAHLRALDAPLSADVTARITADGRPGALSGRLSVGQGAVIPRRGAAPIALDGAEAVFAYDPEAGRIDLQDLTLATADGRIALTGQVDLDDGGGETDLTASARIAAAEFDGGLGDLDLLPGPVSVRDARLSLSAKLDPLRVEVTELVLPDPEGGDVTLSALATLATEGWGGHVGISATTLGAERMAALWPLTVAPGARRWVTERLEAGTASDLDIALSWPPGQPRPRTSLSLDFDGGRLTALPFLPPVTGARGRLAIADDRLDVTVDAGRVTMPGRGPVDLSGTTVSLPDLTRRPTLGRFVVAAEGQAPDILSVIEAEPLSLLSRGGRTPDLVTGRAQVTAVIETELRRGLTGADIDVTAEAVITDLASGDIVPGRRLTSALMPVAFDGLTLSGQGRAALDGVPFDGDWRIQVVGEGAGTGSVAGTVPLSAVALSDLGVALPGDMVSGAGTARVDVALRRGAPPRLAVQSDLRGIGLDLPAIGWSKSPGAAGTLDLSVTLGDRPDVTGLSLFAPGLEASGDLRLGPGGRLEALTLGRAAVGGWFDGRVIIAGRGPGQPPAVTVTGGTLDIRRARLGGGGDAGGGQGGDRGPIDVTLDRLILTDTISLTEFDVDLSPGASLAGAFSGRVNGGAEVAGVLQGRPEGVAIGVQSRDAGAILSDAGLFRRLHGGTLDLRLEPVGPAGTWDGTLNVTDVRLADAPAVASLLSVISVVGLLDQLRGQGIPFDDVSAQFRLSPGGITIYESSAVGAALGLSADGTYDPVTRTMDMQGVVSPVYFLNRVGAFLTRSGEGLFGANFTLRGPASAPAVSVNPLSLLTPGMFREIFRRPPPPR